MPACSSRERRSGRSAELSETAERVRKTRDLSQRIDVDGTDELATLARTFNAMLESLDEAAQRQRQLVHRHYRYLHAEGRADRSEDHDLRRDFGFAEAPDRGGKAGDVVLGYDSLDGYAGGNKGFLGAIVGRYANRIAHGTFTLNGKTYSVPKNDGESSLHGGTRGFDKVVWQGAVIENGVELTYVSQDGDQGYPGTLTATVRYTLRGNALHIDYSATTTADTVVNITNHSYFNLAGAGNGDILGEQIKLNASRYTPIDNTLIPTGELAQVAGTPFDFRKATAIGERINADNEQIRFGKGYDHNWVLDSAGWKACRSCRSLRFRERARFAGVDHSAGNTILFGKFSGRHHHVQRRQGVWPKVGILPGDATFSGFAQPSKFSHN